MFKQEPACFFLLPSPICGMFNMYVTVVSSIWFTDGKKIL